MVIVAEMSDCNSASPPPSEGVIISQPILRFLGVVFDVDHDSEGPRAPKAHLDTVMTTLSSHLGRPRRGNPRRFSLNTPNKIVRLSSKLKKDQP